MTRNMIRKMWNAMVIPGLAALLLSLAAPAASASPIILIVLDSYNLLLAPGQSGTFQGTVTNLTNDVVDLNGCQIDLAGNWTLDTNPFFSGPLSVDPGAQTVTFQMFTVGAPGSATTLGATSGFFSIFGGARPVGSSYDPTTSDLLGIAPFTVTLVPEPGAGLLLLGGLAAMALARRRAA